MIGPGTVGPIGRQNRLTSLEYYKITNLATRISGTFRLRPGASLPKPLVVFPRDRTDLPGGQRARGRETEGEPVFSPGIGSSISPSRGPSRGLDLG
jgi:hypothetical protein